MAPTHSRSAPGGGDPLDELARRVRAAQEAAERVMSQAAPGARPADAQALGALIELGRGMVPGELRDSLAELVRELLLLLRALIDWYLERSEAEKASTEVEDIPIV